MKKIKIKSIARKIPANIADVITPVSIYLKIRDVYPNSILLESSDYHGNSNSLSFICFEPIAEFLVDNGTLTTSFPDGTSEKTTDFSKVSVPDRLDTFIKSFDVDGHDSPIKINGFFGYAGYDAVQYFETIKFKAERKSEHVIPEMRYVFYKYILAFNHFSNLLYLIENLTEGATSEIDTLVQSLSNRSVSAFNFKTEGEEKSNITDEQYLEMVKKGKESCYRGDVFQIVLSRQFSQGFKGDEFNVYRALRNINPSPYLFYFDYGGYKIFGSSPEAQLIINKGVATINPIAGTFRRTGDDIKDKELAVKLSLDPKENAEHVMLVDLARNDLSRNCKNVKVNTFKEVQYYLHVLHLVSDVSGELKPDSNTCRVMANTFPAGTLSGAPKFKAMELIDSFENQNRGFYGGCIGNIGLDGGFNQAIMIRSFLSKNNTLFCQAGAGVVSVSVEELELAEVNNKLGALKKAIEIAKEF